MYAAKTAVDTIRRSLGTEGVGHMSLYSRLIFPWLCDLALSQPLIAEHRRQLLSAVGGNVLEVGFGTGLNLPHYPPDVRQITAVDPNRGMHRRAQRRMKQAAVDVDLRFLSGERLPFDNNRFDCVVTTFTMCSVVDPRQALQEIVRVLKPKGRFFFLEHGLSPDPAIQQRQRRLNWLQSLIGDGCKLDRNMKELISAHAFNPVDVEEFYLEKMPKTHGYMYRGIATKWDEKSNSN